MVMIDRSLLVKDCRFQYSLRFLKISRFYCQPTRFQAGCGPPTLHKAMQWSHHIDIICKKYLQLQGVKGGLLIPLNT